MFEAGVASGDVTSTSVVLWTRVDAATDLEIAWQIGRPGEPAARSGQATARSADDHTVHVDVDGLDPATTYEFTFRAADEEVTGRTGTLPRTADRFRFAAACCSRWGWPGFELFDQIADEQVDLLLHLGDSIYEIGEVPPSGVSTEPPWDCRSLADYRRRYRQYRSHPALRRLFGEVPMLVVWDDHEVVDNAPEPGEADRRRAGQQAWAEWMPSRRATSARPLDRFVSIDGLLDLALVDSRFGGRSPTDIDGPGAAGPAPGSLLADEQWERLDEFSRRATAPWFVFANQVQVGPMTLAARPAAAWPPWRRIVNPDQWDGYPHDRARLYGLLAALDARRVVLSGDLHSSWSRTLVHDGRELAHEFTSPSVSGSTYADAVRERLPIPAGLLARWLRLLNSGIDHLDLTRHGYLICDLTPEAFTTTFVMADGDRHVVALGGDA